MSLSLRQVRFVSPAQIQEIPAERFADFLTPKEKTPAETAKQTKEDAASDNSWFSKTGALWDKGVSLNQDKTAKTTEEEVF